MSDSQAITEIINWCDGLNTYITDDNNKFPKVCSLTTNNKLTYDLNENPPFSNEAGSVSTLNSIRSIDNPNPISKDNLELLSLRYCCTIHNTEKKKKQVLNAKQDFEIASKRAEVTRDPASHISRYGTHFAFGKPLRFSSIPYLLTLIIFFFILSIGILLESSGQKISITSSGPSWFGNFISTFTSSWSQSEGSFKISLIVISILVGAVGYYGAEKLKEYISSKAPK